MLAILLEEKGLLKPKSQGLDFFVAYTDKEYFRKAVEITAKLRRAGKKTNFSYKSANLAKQLKQASTQSAQKCVIIGEELNKNQLVVKDMKTGRQELVPIDEFL